MLYFSHKSTSLVSIKKYSNNINEIELYKDEFQFKEGEWIMVNCPQISRYEWHPFTITSNPVEFGKISFHVKEQGDWTSQMIRYLLHSESSSEGNNLLNVSYPYGSRQESFTKYHVTVLIAGGIGITAFMSLLQQLGCSMGHGKSNVRVKKVYLYWICRNTQDFLAFLPRLQLINRDLQREQGDTPLTINLYLTGESSIELSYPPFVFNLGRPDFDEIYEDLYNKYKDLKIKILFCGSKNMEDSLYSKCKKWNKKHPRFLIFQKGEVFN
jgi:NADPH oxidase